MPPDVWIDELSENIFGSITFLNIPNNILKNNLLNKYLDIVFLGVYKIQKNKWELIKVYKCKPFEFSEIDRKSLSVSNTEIVVVVPKKINQFPKVVFNLPEPTSLRVDRSPIAERVSINYSLGKSSTSYQGEYPFAMTSLEKGSFLSFDILKNPSKSNFKNFLILINIFKKANNQENLKVEFFNPKEIKNTKYFYAKRNAFTIVDINLLENQIEDCDILFIKSNKCSFIPLILSVNIKSQHLSFEHTHPPSELFYGLNKSEAIKFLKKQWI